MAPATDMTGTLILATHGIAGGPGAAAAHASAIRARGGSAEVRVGCLKAEPVARQRPSRCAETGHGRAAADGRGLHPCRPASPPARDRPRLPLAPHRPIRHQPPPVRPRPRPRPVAARSSRLAARDHRPAPVGHGTPRHAASAAHTRAMAEALSRHGFFAVGHALLEVEPLPAPTATALPGDRVLAVGLFLDNGPHGDADVRAALADVSTPVAYAGAIGADPALVALILAGAAVVVEHPVGTDHRADDRRRRPSAARDVPAASAPRSRPGRAARECATSPAGTLARRRTGLP